MSLLTNWTPPRIARDTVMQGRSVRLEPLDARRHATDLFAANGPDAQMWTYMPYGPFSSHAAYHRWVAEAASDPDTWFYAIRDQEQGAWAGVASYLRIAPEAGSIEIGHLAFSPALQKRTAATEAISLMIGQAFAAGFRRVEWKCDARNTTSRRAAERFGFSFEGVFRQHMIVKGRNRDTAWFAIIDGEWPAVQAAHRAWLSPANFDAAGRQLQALGALTGPLLASRDPGI